MAVIYIMQTLYSNCCGKAAEGDRLKGTSWGKVDRQAAVTRLYN